MIGRRIVELRKRIAANCYKRQWDIQMAKKRTCIYPRQPFQRKGESWQDYNARWEAWHAIVWPPERIEAEKVRAAEARRINEEHQRHYHEEYVPAMIERIKRAEAPSRTVFFWFGAGIKDKYSDARHWNLVTAGYITQSQLDFLMHRWYGTPLPPPCRPADRCLQHEDHPCFMPIGPARYVQVRWCLPLSPWYFPSRELQPLYIQREYSKLFCCSEAAFIFARKKDGESCESVRLVKGCEKGGEIETVSEFAPRFFGLKPCWYS